MNIDVDGLKFEFPESWRVSEYDEWSFYCNQFQRQMPGLKAVDLVAVNGSEAYLIEVKDYSGQGTPKPSDLPQNVAKKVLHTLAALLPASLRANDAEEKAMAGALLKCRTLRVVLHADNPKTKPYVVDPSDLKQKLKMLLKAVDPHLTVSSRKNPNHVPWTVHR